MMQYAHHEHSPKCDSYYEGSHHINVVVGIFHLTL